MWRPRSVPNRVSFLGQLPHDPMVNLTNSNLEAMKTGACMIIPVSQPERGIDSDTDELVRQSAVIRVTSVKDAAGLPACTEAS